MKRGPGIPVYSEQDMARCLVGHLREQGYRVYQEVCVLGASGRADIVAIRGKEARVIECKVALSFALMEQAERWLNHATYVQVAFLPGGRHHTRYMNATDPQHRPLAHRLLEFMGVGALIVAPSPESPWIKEVARARKRFRPPLLGKLLNSLDTMQEHYAEAGTSGTHWTAFKRTARSLRAKVAEQGSHGILARELVRRVTHHYSSERSAVSVLVKAALQGEVAGVAARLVPITPEEQQKYGYAARTKRGWRFFWTAGAEEAKAVKREDRL